MIKVDEKHLEDILFEKLQTLEGIRLLSKKGLHLPNWQNFKVFRQFNLGEYGIPDIIKIDFTSYDIKIKVIELKITDFNIAHLLQLGRYMSGLHRILESSFISDKVSISGMLIVADFDPRNDYAWLDHIISENVRVFSTEYGLDGLTFSEIFTGGWQKSGCDHSIKKYINPSSFKELYRKAYFESKEIPDNPF